MKTQLIVRPANDNPLILPFHQSTKVVACDCHCFNNCLISKVCAQISNSLSYTQISKRPSAAITVKIRVKNLFCSKLNFQDLNFAKPTIAFSIIPTSDLFFED